MTSKAKQTVVKEVSATQENINLPIIIGWRDGNSVAETIWSCMHETLLMGNLVLAYRGGDNQIVISQYPDGFYGVSTVTPGYTSLVPYICKDYILNEVFLDLEKFKLDKKLLENLKNIL